ncbi:MAG: hypothetical protein GY898_25805 [Proteobacteria bacterium]|nr:hypothetical protein [Pseudomonadota bacterium]
MGHVAPLAGLTSMPSDELPRIWRVLRAIIGVGAVWIGADLLLGLRLPGAAILEQAAFALVVELPVYAIYLGPLLIPVGVIAAVVLRRSRDRVPALWTGATELVQAAIWAAAATVALVGILKMRSLGLVGLAVVAAATVVWTRRDPERRFDARVALALAAVPVAVGAVQLYAFVWSDSIWRRMVEAINAGDGPAAMMLAPTIALGVGLAVVLLTPAAFEDLTTDRLVPRWAPRFFVAALLVGQLGHVRAFADPYFSLWNEEVPESMTRLDREPTRVHPEAFRLAASDDGRWLVVVYRQSTRLARFDLLDGRMSWLPLRLRAEGTIENIVWDDARRRFLVSFERDDPIGTDSLLTIAEDGAIGQIELPDHGWIASMAVVGERLVLGYEARPKLAIVDLRTDTFEAVQPIPALGDVEEGVAVDGSFYVVPLHHPWGVFLSEVDLAAGEVTRRLLVGGANQQLEAVGSKLLVGRYYASRVEVVDRVAWKREAPLQAGFGVRAVAADADRGVVVTGGQYEGRLRVHDLGSGELLATVPSCGYVKDLVIVDGQAMFAGLCGVYRVDLDEVLGR